jgi:hypothetical protein
MTAGLHTPLVSLIGGADGVNPGLALDRLMALPASSAVRNWQEPHRAIAIRATARRLAAGATPEWALWGGMLEATGRHGRELNR